jgi:hypothetical protein
MTSADTYAEFVRCFERMGELSHGYFKDMERINQLYTKPLA